MRGKGIFDFSHEMFEGITPACAGKSSPVLLCWNGVEDHPRMCGEKHKLPAGKVQDAGITPAYAGKR